MIKKILTCLLCLCFLVVYASDVNAGGVPVQQSTVNLNFSLGSININSSNYDIFQDNSYYDPAWGTISSYAYYRALNTPPPTYIGTGYYITSYDLTIRGTCHTVQTYVGARLEGRNSTSDSWTVIKNFSLERNTTHNFVEDLPIDKIYKQIRVVGICTGSRTDINCTFTGTLNSIKIAILSADQDTVEAARIAANEANANAQLAATRAQTAATNATNAYNAANSANNILSTDSGVVQDNTGTVLDAARASQVASEQVLQYTYDQAESKSIIDLIKETRQTINNIQQLTSPVITKVQGLGGATCTTSDTYTIVVSTNPTNGVVLTATCSGPSNPIIVINGDTITLHELNNGAYTVTIKASLGDNSVSTSHVFFKL